MQLVSNEGLLEKCLATIAAREKEIKALLTIVKPENEQMAGTPFVVSDNLCTQGIKTTAGSRILNNFIPPYNAEVIDKVIAAGGLLLGKAQVDEFGLGPDVEKQITANPRNLKTVPGGACGGSAAAVAAGEAVFALGSDLGGDLRQPAALCGLVGLKPTYGTVSRYGLMAAAASLEQVGCLTKGIKDCALIMSLLAGPDKKDANVSLKTNVDYTKFKTGDLQGLKIGIPWDYFQSAVAPEIISGLQEVVTILKEKGIECREVSLPRKEVVEAVFQTILAAEVSSNLARYDGVRYGWQIGAENIEEQFKKTRAAGLGKKVKEQILLGTYLLSEKQYEPYYLKALKVRALIRAQLEEVLQSCEVLLLPTTTCPEFKFGEKEVETGKFLTVLANLSGLPALTLPWGIQGIQLLGRAFDEETLFRLGYFIELEGGRNE